MSMKTLRTKSVIFREFEAYKKALEEDKEIKEEIKKISFRPNKRVTVSNNNGSV